MGTGTVCLYEARLQLKQRALIFIAIGNICLQSIVQSDIFTGTVSYLCSRDRSFFGFHVFCLMLFSCMVDLFLWVSDE